MSENNIFLMSSSQVDLIWHTRPTRKVDNARALIIFLPWFLHKVDLLDQHIALYLKCLILSSVLHQQKHLSVWSKVGVIAGRT